MILGFSARARQADPHEAEVAAWWLSYAAQVMPRSEVATVLAAFDEDRQVASQPLLTRRTDSQSTVLAVGEVKHWMQAICVRLMGFGAGLQIAAPPKKRGT